MVLDNLTSQRLNQQLNIIKIQIGTYIRIKSSYSNQNSSDIYNLDLCFKAVSAGSTKTVFLGDLIQDICDYIISPFLAVQNSSIRWNYVSIMHPKNKSNKNILNILIRGVHGQILDEQNGSVYTNSGVLKFCARYEGSKVSSITKLAGVGAYYLNPESYNQQACLDIIDQCERIFYQSIELKRIKIVIEFVQEKNLRKTNIKNTDNKNKKAVKVQKIYKKPILVTALPE
uniref:Uncharacterized protein n=1 Tax=Gracilaria firma TaxID=2510791 RepID=A0A1P8D6K3_9FLOR|nr:hypothetical protein [Gracilaria firma]APR74435.1 hypothetical protein [Gracilaria firma]